MNKSWFSSMAEKTKFKKRNENYFDWNRRGPISPYFFSSNRIWPYIKNLDTISWWQYLDTNFRLATLASKIYVVSGCSGKLLLDWKCFKILKIFNISKIFYGLSRCEQLLDFTTKREENIYPIREFLYDSYDNMNYSDANNNFFYNTVINFFFQNK